MKQPIIITLSVSFFLFTLLSAKGQTREDSPAVKQVALDYIESQHNVKPEQFVRAAHPRMVKRTFWTHIKTGKEYIEC